MRETRQMSGREFAAWMKTEGMSLTEASLWFGVSVPTIYTWRSKMGIPPTRLRWVSYRMAEFEHSRLIAPVVE